MNPPALPMTPDGQSTARRNAHEAWSEAEHAARRAAHALHDGWLAFYGHGNPAPSGAEHRKAALLRAAATLALMDAQAEALLNRHERSCA